ncbi:hypothetical protein ACP275_12G070800 [Erythranthe tilingii]
MTKDEDFKLLKIQTCVLRVNIHCDGCYHKVKKLLQRIEGVYQVKIDSDQQRVSVQGSVDSETLIKKLIRAGKHAEPWSQKITQTLNQNQNQNQTGQKQKPTCIKDNNKNKKPQQNPTKNIESSLRNKHKFPFNFDEDNDSVDGNDDDYGEEEMHLIRHKINQLALMKQQAEAINNAKKGGNNNGATVAAADRPNNNSKTKNNGNNNNGGASPNGRKGNQMQNMAMKGNIPGSGIDQKTLAALNKMKNDEGKRGNSISTMMNLAGFHGNNNHPSGIGGTAGFQQNNGAFQGGFPVVHGGHMNNPAAMMMNMDGYYNNNPASVMMNMNMQNRQQQPQMMYNRSPFVPASTTGFYYNNYYGTVPYSLSGGEGSAAAAHMFSDENTSSCSVM